MMTTRCMEATGSGPRSHQGTEHRPAAARRCGLISRRLQDGLGGQPAVEEATLAFLDGTARDRTQHAPALAVECPTPQRARFEADQDVEAEHHQPGRVL